MKKSYQQQGFSYLAVLFLVSAIAISMAIVTENEANILKREKELDWLSIGQQYQQAIASYYRLSPNGLKSLPNNVDELILDKRFISPVRHLRRLYLDPLTLKPWEPIKNEEDQLIGVYSTSQAPIFISKTVQILNQAGDMPNIHSDVKFQWVDQEKNNSDEDENNEDEIENNDDENSDTNTETELPSVEENK